MPKISRSLFYVGVSVNTLKGLPTFSHDEYVPNIPTKYLDQYNSWMVGEMGLTEKDWRQ
jgi:hypothetical protein